MKTNKPSGFGKLTTSEVEQLFGGLYYEEGGYFHPVGSHPKFIERAEKLLAKEKMELIEEISRRINEVVDYDLLPVHNRSRIEAILEAFKKEIGGSDTNAVTKEEDI